MHILGIPNILIKLRKLTNRDDRHFWGNDTARFAAAPRLRLLNGDILTSGPPRVQCVRSRSAVRNLCLKVRIVGNLNRLRRGL